MKTQILISNYDENDISWMIIPEWQHQMITKTISWNDNMNGKIKWECNKNISDDYRIII